MSDCRQSLYLRTLGVVLFGVVAATGTLLTTSAIAMAPDLRVVAKSFSARNTNAEYLNAEQQEHNQFDTLMLNSNSVVETGDGIQLSVRTERRGYLYVFAVGASGSAVLLHPISRRSEQALVGRDQVIAIPRDGAFFTLVGQVGREFIVALSARTPIRDIDALLLTAEEAVADKGGLNERALAAFGDASVVEFEHVAPVTVSAANHGDNAPRASVFAQAAQVPGVLGDLGNRIHTLLGSASPNIPPSIVAQPAAPKIVTGDTATGSSSKNLFESDEKTSADPPSPPKSEREQATWNQLFADQPQASAPEDAPVPVIAEPANNKPVASAPYKPTRGPLDQATLNRVLEKPPAEEAAPKAEKSAAQVQETSTASSDVEAPLTSLDNKASASSVVPAQDPGAEPQSLLARLFGGSKPPTSDQLTEETTPAIASDTLEAPPKNGAKKVALEANIAEPPSLFSRIFGISTDANQTSKKARDGIVEEPIVMAPSREVDEPDAVANSNEIPANPSAVEDESTLLLSQLLNTNEVTKASGETATSPTAIAADEVAKSNESDSEQEDRNDLFARLFGSGNDPVQDTVSGSNDSPVAVDTVVSLVKKTRVTELEAEAPLTEPEVSSGDSQSLLSQLFERDEVKLEPTELVVVVERSNVLSALPAAEEIRPIEPAEPEEAAVAQHTVEEDGGVVSAIVGFFGFGGSDEPETGVPEPKAALQAPVTRRPAAPRIVVNDEDNSVRLPQIGGAPSEGTSDAVSANGGGGVLQSAGASIVRLLLGEETEFAAAGGASSAQPEPQESMSRPTVAVALTNKSAHNTGEGATQTTETRVPKASDAAASAEARSQSSTVSSDNLPKIRTPVTVALRRQQDALSQTSKGLVEGAPIALQTSRARPALDVTTDGPVVSSVMLVVSPKGRGTGIVVDREGHILTNWQVVRGFSRVSVWLKAPALESADLGRPMTAVVSRTNRASDLALLRIEGSLPELKPLSLAANISTTKRAPVHLLSHTGVGQWRYTSGTLVTAKPRHSWLSDGRHVHKAIVVHAKLDERPSAVGGPLLNDSMEVVGISSQVAKRSAHIYAVSVEEIRRFLSGEVASLR